MPTKDELTKRAEDAGLEVDGRWSKDTLIEAMDVAGIPTGDERKAASTVPILLHYDIWVDERDEIGSRRRKAGRVVEVDTASARALIKEGKAERADPMPGD